MAANASAQLHAIAVKLKAAGEGQIKVQLARDLRVVAAPLVESVRESARSQLPKSGGLAAEQASQPIRVSVLTSARSAGVSIRTKTLGSKQTDQGFVRHPTFGRRGSADWKRQEIPRAEGWWTKTLIRKGPLVSRALNATIARVNKQIQGL